MASGAPKIHLLREFHLRQGFSKSLSHGVTPGSMTPGPGADGDPGFVRISGSPYPFPFRLKCID
jgi:hypothetical protein